MPDKRWRRSKPVNNPVTPAEGRRNAHANIAGVQYVLGYSVLFSNIPLVAAGFAAGRPTEGMMSTGIAYLLAVFLLYSAQYHDRRSRRM